MIHFAAPLAGALRLAGECNRCGLCCTGVYQGRKVRCEHLFDLGKLNGGHSHVGLPGGTVCVAYERRVDGMPIRMRYADTAEVAYQGRCFKNSQAETLVILHHIGKGCSLTPEVPCPGSLSHSL